MSTALIEELEQAAKRSDWLAFQCTPQAVGEARSKELRGIHEAEARRLRQRAAWVREMADTFEAQSFNGSSRGDDILGVLKRLAGPDIPAAGPVPCCAEGAKLAEDWVARYKCPVHDWQDWKPRPGIPAETAPSPGTAPSERKET